MPIDLAGGAAPPPDVFSNARPPRSARAFAILMHHVQAEEIVRTKRVLQELLRGLHENDRVAVVSPSRSDLGQGAPSHSRCGESRARRGRYL